MKNKHTQPIHRVAMINRWKESGKSIKAFCKDENIVNSTFHYWQKKLQGKNKTSSSTGCCDIFKKTIILKEVGFAEKRERSWICGKKRKIWV